jgi:hypothetical protein
VIEQPDADPAAWTENPIEPEVLHDLLHDTLSRRRVVANRSKAIVLGAEATVDQCGSFRRRASETATDRRIEALGLPHQRSVGRFVIEHEDHHPDDYGRY